MSADVASQLAGLLASRASPRALAWFGGVFDRLTCPLDLSLFGPAFSGAGRRVGRSRVTLIETERATFVSLPAEPGADGLDVAAGIVPEGWGLDECARGALVLRAVTCLQAGEDVAFVDDLYRRGEVRERQALLRVMAALPDPARFVETAVEACRTSLQNVFEAIACDNVYPQRFFPDHNFNQMVLKALFTDAPVERIVGLAERVNEDLERMSLGYASERRAAGRKVPDGIAYITTAYGAKLHRAHTSAQGASTRESPEEDA